ncbi:MAG: MBL fold metallo-hydrolase [Gemmatimonadetes bacterium]|nr:MBL fold metallo-hydrolase [Gemmatimonadota bacterium]MDA1102163.1 MBL fold metallo-hydrolase [Gemmatimonadota bacterium]
MDGTKSYLVGRRKIAVIDPGPDVEDHVRALALRVSGAESVVIVLTHGHDDHAASALGLAREIGAEVLAPIGIEGADRVLHDGDSIETDVGTLLAVHTPGHTVEHLCFHWPAEAALFAGDMVLGHGDTTWVAEYPGCVADYLASIDRLRGLDLSVIYPGHGPALTDPTEALDRFAEHRRGRVRQVATAMAANPDASVEELLGVVYGDTIPSSMRGAARQSLSALVDHVRETRP